MALGEANTEYYQSTKEGTQMKQLSEYAEVLLLRKRLDVIGDKYDKCIPPTWSKHLEFTLCDVRSRNVLITSLLWLDELYKDNVDWK
jgi:hypothetical protein